MRDAHPAWGARKIARCLERESRSPPAFSTVHQILRRTGRVRPPPGGEVANQRFEMSAPNLLWQMDFKGWVRLGNRQMQRHPLTVVDDHSRYELAAPCLQACADQRGETVRDRLELTFRRYGLPKAFFVDNGTPWGDPSGERWTRRGMASQARHRGHSQPSVPSAEPGQERTLSPYAQRRGVRTAPLSRSRRGTTCLRCLAGSLQLRTAARSAAAAGAGKSLPIEPAINARPLADARIRQR